MCSSDDTIGWVSIGSLDGFLYSISPTGTLKKFAKASPLNSVIQVAPVLDCSGYAVYISQTNMEGKSSRVIGDYTFVSAMKPKNVVFSLLVPATEAFYWSETYPGKLSTLELAFGVSLKLFFFPLCCSVTVNYLNTGCCHQVNLHQIFRAVT